MTSTRKTALVAGILYLITEVTAIAALLTYGSVLTDPAFIISAFADTTSVLVGAFLEVLLAIAVVGSSVTLYPVIKTYGPGLALGYVAGRLIEAAIILFGAISLLTVVTLQSQLSGATDAEAVAAVTVGQSKVALHDWTFLFGPKLALGVNTVLLAILMFRSQLVPRVIAILGLVGGSLVFLSGTAVLFGAYPDLSTIGVAAAMPVLAWELSVAFWMIIKGFRTVTPDEAPATVRPPTPAAA
jgi:hypothetical protein